MTNGIIFCVCSILATSVLQFVLKQWQKEYNKIQGKKGSQRSRCQWWALLQGFRQICHLRRVKPQGRKAMKVRAPGVRKLGKMIDRVPGHPVVDRDVYSARYSRWNDDKAWSSQEWKADKSTDDRTERHVVTSWVRHTSPNQVSFMRRPSTLLWMRKNLTVQPVVYSQREARPQQFIIGNDETESELSMGPRSFLNRVNDRVRKKTKTIFDEYCRKRRKAFYDMGNVHVCNIGISSIHGKELLGQLSFHHEYKRPHIEIRHICNISVWTRWDLWSGNNWLGKIIHGNICLWFGDERVINLQRTKVYVFSDSVLCLGKIHENFLSKTAWEDRLGWFKSSPEYRNFDRIDVEPMEFEWNIFSGFNTLQLSQEVKHLLLRLGEIAENFTGRIIFMSMFNDISCGSRDNEK